MMRRAARLATLAAVLVACAPLTFATPAAADVTTHTPVMGPSLMSAQQLATWYGRHHGSNSPQIPGLGNNVQTLAQVFIDEGTAEGVRGDMAFVQSMLETGWLSFAGSQIPPDAYNYAGIYAFNGRAGLPNCAHGDSSPSRCMGAPGTGARVQMQLLRSYADPQTRTMSGRLISAPSDRVGAAPLWEYFGGNNCPCGKLIWASASNYGLRIIQMYSQALAESGLGGACVPYSTSSGGTTSGNGYWEVTQDNVVHAFGSAVFKGDASTWRLNAPVVGGDSTSGAGGYWLLGQDGGVFAFGTAPFYGSAGGWRLNQPVNGFTRTADDHGYWLVASDGGVFAFGNAPFFGSAGAWRMNAPVVAFQPTATGRGYWLFGADGGVFGFGDARMLGSAGGDHLTSPVVSVKRTKSGNGYWMLLADGRVLHYGDAWPWGDIAGCSSLGAASRMLVTPSGLGYWIATANGAVLPFGDAKRLGFPQSVGGPAVALLGAN